jgi:hypothetical protein
MGMPASPEIAGHDKFKEVTTGLFLVMEHTPPPHKRLLIYDLLDVIWHVGLADRETIDFLNKEIKEFVPAACLDS